MTRVMAGMLAVTLTLAILYASLNETDSTMAQLAAERTERTAIEQAERTQRVQIEQNGMTERTYISAQSLMWLATERESTLRLVVVAVIVVAAVAGAITFVVLLMRDRRKPEEKEMTYLLSVRRQLPHGWTVVEHPQLGWIATDGDEYMTPRDVRALLVQR